MPDTPPLPVSMRSSMMSLHKKRPKRRHASVGGRVPNFMLACDLANGRAEEQLLPQTRLGSLLEGSCREQSPRSREGPRRQGHGGWMPAMNAKSSMSSTPRARTRSAPPAAALISDIYITPRISYENRPCPCNMICRTPAAHNAQGRHRRHPSPRRGHPHRPQITPGNPMREACVRKYPRAPRSFE